MHVASVFAKSRAEVQSLIVVPANDIDAAGLEVAADLPPAWLDSQLEDAQARAVAPGKITGRLSRSGRADVVVRCKVTCEVELPCARCLAPARVDIQADLSLLLEPRASAPSAAGAHGKSPSARAKTAAAGSPPKPLAKASAKGKPRPHVEYEFGSSEADLDEYDGEKVVLDDFIREAILLELPSFPLCAAEPDRDAEASTDSPEAPPAARRESPFAALRHLLPGSPLPPEESLGNAKPPSPADLRRITRAKNKAKPKIRSSALHRGKK